MKLSKVMWTIGSAIGAQQAIKAIQRLEMDDVLGLIGVERRRSALSQVLPAIGLVAVGAAVGAGAALLFAPSGGKELRTRLSERLDEARDKLTDKLQDVAREMPSLSNSNQANSHG
ncbi:MAG TPA: YtxH domain-containing protein [Polyangiaceae bacterium]